MFAASMQQNQKQRNFAGLFGDVFAEKENLLKLIYQMLSIFNSTSIMSEEMANQLVKNLTFLQGQLLKKCSNETVEDEETYVKVYKKASFIGRKIMGDATESTDVKLEALV